jgi:glycerol-3-phosphate dehydrogenase
MYDVAVVGAGVVGACVARLLSSFNISAVLLERRADVSFGVTKANSGIIHAGFHHDPSTLKARLEVRGNALFDRLQAELNFPFRRVGGVVAAFSYEELQAVDGLYRQGIANGAPRLEIVNRDRILELEPKLHPAVVGGLWAPTAGVIEPYRFVFALVENACANGVKLLLDWDLAAARRKGDRWLLSAADGRTLEARRAVNAAGLYADEVSAAFGGELLRILPRKGEEYMLDKNAPGFPAHVIFPVPVKNSKGVLVIPTAEGTTMVGPTAVDVESKDDESTSPENLERIFSLAARMIPSVSRRDLIASFAGLRPVLAGEDFFIARSQKAPGLIQAAGIQSPGLTAAPAIAERIADLLKEDGLALEPRADFHPLRPAPRRAAAVDFTELDALARSDPAFANIVCRCEGVSEAEVVEAIRKGHTTLDGIKLYTRARMGRCQGGFCTYRLLSILTRETGLPLEKITKRGGGSYLVAGQVGGVSAEDADA